jgi:phosphoenolpyruvate carboxykinase (ATP)
MRGWVTELMPRVSQTAFGNLNYEAAQTARLSRSTFFVTTDETNPQNTISPEEAAEWAARQDAHIAEQDMILIEGYIGPDPDFRTGARVYIEKSNANIPGMQQQLFFPRDDAWTPELTTIYTPTLKAPGKPDDCLILVDLDTYVTRVFGSDYFGESKMGGLRMWNHLIYERGGLAMHSGLKVYPDINGEEVSVLILGLSGTGKTTTTFRERLGSLPVQDDFNALMPGGEIRTSEAGCFAKTFGLDPDGEPTIYHATASADAWLENTHVSEDGSVDFFNDSHTANGRSTFPMASIRHRDPANVPPPRALVLLNRNENIIPGVARLRSDQAVAYFMLGETKGTSAGGADEAGKNLRVPGTNPFFFHNDALQGNRLLELLDTMPYLTVYLMNTGAVGGPESAENAKKVKIDHSTAILEAVVSDSIDWEVDPDFGYEVASSIPEFDDDELLRPRTLYERQSRLEEYGEIVAKLKTERLQYLNSFPGLAGEVIAGM